MAGSTEIGFLNSYHIFREHLYKKSALDLIGYINKHMKKDKPDL
jgi:hypothetical protein